MRTLIHAFVTPRVDYCNTVGKSVEVSDRQIAAST